MSYNQMLQEAAVFILACYSQTGKTTLTDARIEAWKTKMRRSALEPPTHCLLPPTSAAFRENALRAHFQVAVWRNALQTHPPLLDPTDHGWSHTGGSTRITPTIVPVATPLAADDLLKVIKCGCDNNTPCSTKSCGCKSHAISCTLFCGKGRMQQQNSLTCRTVTNELKPQCFTVLSSLC